MKWIIVIVRCLKARFALTITLAALSLAIPVRGVAQLTFGSPTGYAVGTRPGAVATGDFNGDGILDLAVANTGSNDVSILLGNTDGTDLALRTRTP